LNDILKPAAILCKVLQQDDLCIVKAIGCIFKVKVSLKSTVFAELTTVKKVIEEFLEANYTHWIEKVEDCILQQLKSQPQKLDIMRHPLTVLSINGWQRSEDPFLAMLPLTIFVNGFVFHLRKPVWIGM